MDPIESKKKYFMDLLSRLTGNEPTQDPAPQPKRVEEMTPRTVIKMTPDHIRYAGDQQRLDARLLDWLGPAPYNTLTDNNVSRPVTPKEALEYDRTDPEAADKRQNAQIELEQRKAKLKAITDEEEGVNG